MKLHLHIGAHKTATSHLQSFFSQLPEGDDFYFLETDIARMFFPMDGNFCSVEDSQIFYRNLAKNNYMSLLISDENICGHTYHIFRDNRLYTTIEDRLEGITFFTEIFEDIEIWFTLRRQETFLPSLYCEALRWGNFKPFSSALNGDIFQSWLPVIDKVKKSFPGVKVNILIYESYAENFSKLIREITGREAIQTNIVDTIVYSSLNNFSIRASALINKLFPFPQRPILIRAINKLSKPFAKSKFQPFSSAQLYELRQLYDSDLKALENDPSVFMFGNSRPVQ